MTKGNPVKTSASRTTSFQTISLWHGKLNVESGRITNLITFRISATGDIEAYENQHRTGKNVFCDLPDAHFINALPDGAYKPGNENDALRKAHGIIPLYYSDLPNAARKKDRLGYAYVEGSTLWLFVMNSAAQGNLPAWQGDPICQERNAFTELVAGVAVDLYNGGSRELAVRFALWNRMEREELYGARLRATVKQRPGMTLWEGTKQIELHDPAATVSNSVNSGQTNAAILDLKGSLFNGNLNHLAANKWDKSESVLPLGYRFRRETNVENVTTIVKGEVVVEDMFKPALIELVEMAAAGASWNAVGRRAIKLNIPQRSPVSKGKTFASIRSSHLTTAARNLVANPAYIGLWRTGKMIVRRNAPVEGATQIRGHILSFDDGATTGHVNTEVTWPLPAEGWGVADETWVELLTRISLEADKATTRKNAAGVAASDLNRRAFSGSPTWDVDGYQYRLIPETPTAYRLRQRDARTGFDDEGRPRGWGNGEGKSIATFHGLALHSSVSVALEAALVELAEADVEFGPISVTSTVGRRKVQDSIQKAVRLETEANECAADADAFDILAVKAVRSGQDNSVDNYVERAETYRVQALVKRAEATKLRSAPEPDLDAESNELISLDLSNPAIVAVALRRFPQRVPPSLVDALVTLGITQTLRFELSDDATMGLWTATCQVPVVNNADENATLTLRGTVPNTAPPAGAKPGQRRIFTDTLARQFLVEQMDLDSIAQTYHRTTLWANTQVHGWLRDHNVTAFGLATAAIWCPIVDTRRAIYAACTEDLSVVADLAPAFVEHIKSIYLGNTGMSTWTPGPWHRQRRLLAALSSTCDGSALKHDIASALSVAPKDLAEVARGWSKKTPVVERVGMVEMRLIRCPHNDCSGHPGFLSQYLVTPETPKGLICSSCRRTPDSADVVFPSDYLLPWEGPSVRLGELPSPVKVISAALLTVQETADRVGCSDYKVRTYIPVARYAGTLAYYHPADVKVMRRQLLAKAARVSNGLFTVQEAAKKLGVHESKVRKLIDAGAAPVRRDPSRPGNKGSWRFVDDAGIEALRNVLTDADRAVDLIGIYEAAALLGIKSTTLRDSANCGDVKFQRTAGQTRRFALDDLDEFARTLTPADLDDTHLGINLAAERVGITTTRLRAAADRGDIKCSLTRKGHRRFAPEDLDVFVRGTGESLIGPAAAAERLGISYMRLRRAANSGQVKCQRTANGTRHYLIADLDEFARTYTPAAAK